MQTYVEKPSLPEEKIISIEEAQELAFEIFEKIIKRKRFYMRDELAIREIIWAAEGRKPGVYIVFRCTSTDPNWNGNVIIHRGFSKTLNHVLWFFHLGDVEDLRGHQELI